MDLSFNSRMETYYQKFFELQEKLRKSEEERIKLEMKFNELVQISREEEQAHYKKLRSQYKKFLEEDRKRQERNEKIVRTLERIEARVNLLASKTERIKILRRQYQSYMQRVSRVPVENRDYIPPNVAEGFPLNEHKPSCDIAMLKKAFGKTNDEKIEILDKYLQSLRSQKDPVKTETKRTEPKTDFNEMKYFDEVSKKLNEGFNSNEANSIAEDIMNSIYARHYKADAKDEAKKIGKFTVPTYPETYSEKDNVFGFGDSYNNRYNADVAKNPSDILNELKNLNTNRSFASNNINKFNQNANSPTREIGRDLHILEGEKRKQYLNDNEPSNAIRSSADQLHTSEGFPVREPQKIYDNEGKSTELTENISSNRPSKTEIDLIESEKNKIHSQERLNWGDIPKKDDLTVQDANNKLRKIKEIAKDVDNSNYSQQNKELQRKLVDASFNENKDKLDRTDIKNKEFENQNVNVEEEYNNNNYEPANYQTKNEISDIDSQNVLEETKFNEEYKSKRDNEGDISAGSKTFEKDEQLGDQLENLSYREESNTKPHGTNEVQSEEFNLKDKKPSAKLETRGMYDEENSQELEPHYDNNDRTCQENIQPYEQTDPYDSSVQRVEQLYGQDGKAIQHYDENGQPIYSYDQPYHENGEPDQQIYNNSGEESQQVAQFDENSQLLQHYDENSHPIQQYDPNNESGQQFDENGQPLQQYDESGQPLQQYDEGGQLTQQYEENGQPLQQYDENGQPSQQYNENGELVPQYDENGQPLQQYDENGQPIQHYDENGQHIQQYDENGQPVQEYDENGQPIQQYDENGQPIQQYDENSQPQYMNEGDGMLQYDENGQIVQQFDENGQRVLQATYDEQYQPYDENGQPIASYDDQLYTEQNVDGQAVQQFDTNQLSEEQNKEYNELSDVNKPDGAEDVNRPIKKNVLDLLDTDSESIKQNTSKISNDSDFDFSNG